MRRALRGISASAIILTALTGCSPYKAGRLDPAMGLPSGLTQASLEQSGPLYGQNSRWWTSFNDPGLNSLMGKAFRGNLDLRQAHERMLQARAKAREMGASRLPALTANASLGRVKQTTSIGPMESDTFQASVAAKYEIDLWGRLGSKSRAAALDSMAAEEALNAMYMSVSAEIADLYFAAIEQKAQLRLSRTNIGALQKIRQSVEARYMAGLVTALDLYQARQNLATASIKTPTLEATLAGLEAGISIAMGNSPLSPSVTIPGALPEAPDFPTAIPSDLLMRRPDVMAALRTLEAKDHRVAETVADRFPSFSLTASYGGASDELSEVLSSPNIFWNALMNIAMPIIDGGKRKAVSERARAALREALAAYHKAVLTAYKDAYVALVRNEKASEQIVLLKQAVTAGENTLRVAEMQYLQGITDYLNVLSAQQQLHAARSALLTSRRQLISARIQLARALGGGWMAEESAMRHDNTDNKARGGN